MRMIAVLVFALAGCVSLPSEQLAREEEMLFAASALTKVAAASEASVRYGKPPENLSDEEFLKFATAHDPGLLQPLAKYRLRALRQGKHAVILVCSVDGAVALIEDAGCTAQSDRHHWQTIPALVCAFTLELEKVCAASKQ